MRTAFAVCLVAWLPASHIPAQESDEPAASKEPSPALDAESTETTELEPAEEFEAEAAKEPLDPAWMASPSGSASETAATAGSPVLVLLVRHAEKAKEPVDNPPLTRAGGQRAQSLAAALHDAGVTAIITTQLRRTRETAQPLAVALGLAPEVVPVGPDVDLHVAAVATAVRRHGGGVVLVVGHTNTIPEIIAALGGPHLSEICETQFANLFVLVLGVEPPRLVRGRYGAADAPPAAGCE